MERFQAGDHVVVAFVPACGRCRPCQQGRAALCESGGAANAAGTLLSGARRLHDAGGDPLHHHLGVSAFADHAVVAAESAIGIPADVPFELAALLAAPCSPGSASSCTPLTSRPAIRSRCSGLGGVGMAAVLGARLGAQAIIAVDAVASKLRGSYLGSSVPRRDIPRCIDHYGDGQLPVKQLLTHRLALDDINAGFDHLHRGEAVRQVVVFAEAAGGEAASDPQPVAATRYWDRWMYSPRAPPTTSPLRSTGSPRSRVSVGQPLTAIPSNGV